MEQHLLEVRNLKVTFKPNKEVIHGINFQLSKGEIVGLVGESGSGKSVSSLSIMRLLNGRAEISGSIILNGQNLLSLKENEMCSIRGNRVSMIFQEPMSSFNPSQKCGHQVAEALLIHQDISKSSAEQRVLELFGEVALPQAEKVYWSYPHELSGGQLQRVMIAMALANQPDLIIADEPTTALDVTVQKHIVQLLKDIADKHKTAILFISHDLGVVKHISDRIIVMRNGEIVESGKTEQVFFNPKHPYTKGLIACRPPLDKRVRRLPTVNQYMNGELDELDQSTSIDGFHERLEQLAHQPTIVDVKDLDCWYVIKRSFFGTPITYYKAVNKVSFAIKKGEILGLVGESGSGKSTTGKALLKLIPSKNGSIKLNGEETFSLSERQFKPLRKEFQIVFQDPMSSLNPRMTIGDAIMEPMIIHKLNGSKANRKKKAQQLLKEVGLLGDMIDRYPHEFSGGQRQRICIARTLALEPSFIVLDESVSALDVSVQAQVLNLLLDLKDKYDLSYLLISHDISVIKFFCDRVIVMKNGEIVERGDAESIYHNPQHPYTQELISAVFK